MRLRIHDGSLDRAIDQIRRQAHADDVDDQLALLSRSLIECGRHAEAEIALGEISADWAAEAVEIQATLAEDLWKSGNHKRAKRLLVRSLRESSNCDEWAWLEAGAMVEIARAAASMSEKELSRAILLEAVTIASRDMNNALDQMGIDASGVIGDIAIELLKLGFPDDARATAELISFQKKREKILSMLSLDPTSIDPPPPPRQKNRFG